MPNSAVDTGSANSVITRLRDWAAAGAPRFAGPPRPDTDDDQASAFRARQLHALLRLTPYTMFANGVNAVLICALFWHRVPRAPLLLWIGALGIVVTTLTFGWWKHGRGPARPRASRKVASLATWHAASLASLYALLPMYLLPRVDEGARLLVATFTAGMMCAGAFAQFTLPRAAVTWVVILTIGAIWGLLASSMPVYTYVAMLLIVYAGVILAIVFSMARISMARLHAEADQERQKQIVDLLLRDFEAHASDWLFETDVAGRLRYVSARLAEILGQTTSALRSLNLVDFIAATTLQGRQVPTAVMQLRERLRRPQAFRDVIVPVRLRQEEHWWTLTARPLIDARGVHEGWRGVGRDVTAARQHDMELARLANLDSLTGLANRHRFRARLAESCSHLPARPCTLLLLDLDNFKGINDTLGHGIGDRLLQTVANRLRVACASADVMARLGGDEFALLYSSTSAPSGGWLEHGQSMLRALREPSIIEGMRIEARASIGIASREPGTSAEALLRNADTALYAAKESGRDAVRVFDSDMRARVRNRLRVLSDLGRALDGRQMRLHYQPQFAFGNGRVTGFEALLRWQHPDRGLVSPSDFITVAEETGLIVPIGAWALRTACEEAVLWPADLHVSVNLSAVQCASRSTVEVVRDVLTHTGLAPNRLELEVTESALIPDSSSAHETLLALKRMGVRIALDDFGTGYSSLSHLRSFSLDKLKIDRTFVAALDGGGERHSHAIVESIIRLAHALTLETVAEGVETSAQADTLRGFHCTGVQGFLFGRPMEAPDVRDFLQRRPHTGLRAAGSIQ
jgi:diguanylate cyclase (GGDEF)-like protein/PAS domain S-box-containing protein